MSTFVLVHGAWHGAWCWSKPTPELEALGHTCQKVVSLHTSHSPFFSVPGELAETLSGL